MGRFLWTLATIIGALWLLGFAFRIAGRFIHILLIVAVIVVLYNLIFGRRRVY